MPEIGFSFDTVLDEHRQLRRRVDDLRTFLREPRPAPGGQPARIWASHLSAQLLQLHDQLCAHFHEEEESGALHELARRHPWAFQGIQTLQSEHEHILRELRAILSAALVYAEGRTPESPHLRRWTQSVLDQLLRHEVEEDDLIARSVATTEREEALVSELDQYSGELPEFCTDALVVPMRAVGWQTTPTLNADASVAEAVELVLQGGATCIVVTRAGAPIGTVTARDLLTHAVGKGVAREPLRVEDVMARQVFTLRPDEPLTHALALMDTGGFRHVLVVDGDKLLGVVTATTVVRYLASLLPEELRVLPTRRHPTDREGA